VDAPLIPDLSIDDYLAGGIQIYNDRAGDGNLQNTTVLASVAYHKFLGSTRGTSITELNKVLTIGLQGGYTSKSVDLSRLYFGDEFNNGEFQPGTSQEYPGLNNKVDYWTVNAGLAWAHAPGRRFNYTLGLGANNLNQPTDKFRKERNSEVGLAMRYTGQAGAVWYWSDKFSFRPGLLYQYQASSTELVGGAEFNYAFGYPEFRSISSAIFAGIWTRSSDAILVTAGFEYRAFRFGIGYDYNTSKLNVASGGNGAFEISLRYIAPHPGEFSKFRTYPCTRF
jgi:type IX secretion system PorP/SprF family membrane protein